MSRLSKPRMFMKIARTVSRRSTCIALRVGAVIVKEGRIISFGYNGSTPNSEHCIEHFTALQQTVAFHFPSLLDYTHSDVVKNLHHDWALEHELHAEMNAILFAAKSGISTDKTEMYTTHSPCAICAKMIVQAGIRRVVYHVPYIRDFKITKAILFTGQVGLEEINDGTD